MRPTTLDQYFGQEHLLAKGKILRNLIEKDQISSMIFWGPPGIGKTTLAKIIANHTKSEFVTFSAVTSGIKDIKKIMQEAEDNLKLGIKTILFIDEIHRFNKAQQDAFLPFVEKGSIILIGATTENPSFEINNALLSRCKVFVLKSLSNQNIIDILKLTLKDNRGFGQKLIDFEKNSLEIISNFSNGDARIALSTLEMIILNSPEDKNGHRTISNEFIKECIGNKNLLFDKNGEEHYNLISALHKSMRNSDPDAAIYWLARLLESGENPLYIARRLIRFASEDIGLSDSKALDLAVNCYQACHFLGLPECNVNLTHAVVYLSLTPKSNALYMAYESAKKDAINQISQPVPLSLRNAPTKLMKELNYGQGYQYAHDFKEKLTSMDCLPKELLNRQYYKPTDQGLERKFKERLDIIKAWKGKNKTK